MKLTKKGFSYDQVNNYGNMFLIGNGHLGYRGTLEEFVKDEKVSLNIVGLYDQYGDKWRESVNAFNPFYFKAKSNGEELSVLTNNHYTHIQELDLSNATFKRLTTFHTHSISTKRFLSSFDDQVFGSEYRVKANVSGDVSIEFGIDFDIFEINGPHYKSRMTGYRKNVIFVSGVTNEGNTVTVALKFELNLPIKYTIENDGGKLLVSFTASQLNDDELVISIIGRVFTAEKDLKSCANIVRMDDYSSHEKNHVDSFLKKFNDAKVTISGNPEAEFNANYAIYHLLILGSVTRTTSIPARGLSGQTYKGAVFWDTEMFLLPFYILHDKKSAENLLTYRIDGLSAAKEKAAKYGYEGAYYAWESQDKGREACSEYNVTDAITGEPIRTYFVDKQIHISIDVVFGFLQYARHFGELSMYYNGGAEVFFSVMKFYKSYSTYDTKTNLYHLLDVLGPDEYHERVDDNAFTNYMVKFVAEETIPFIEKLDLELLTRIERDLGITISEIKNFIELLYLPQPDSDGVIEQFEGYFVLEDVLPSKLKTRLKNKKEYWGGPNGVATFTKVIKQADVVTLLALFPERFSKKILIANYNYYEKYTEHGSSLSKTMYGLLASYIGKHDIAYQMFIDSASIDLGAHQKEWAGTIYIGGTHPASVGGSYMILTYGLTGLSFSTGKPVVKNNLPKCIEGIEYRVVFNNEAYSLQIGNGGK